MFLVDSLLYNAGLQITVSHQTMADQNWPMSDQITTFAGHFVRPMFLLERLTILFTNKIGLSYTLLFPMYLCVATITGFKIGTDTVVNASKSSGLVATKKVATSSLCATDR